MRARRNTLWPRQRPLGLEQLLEIVRRHRLILRFQLRLRME